FPESHLPAWAVSSSQLWKAIEYLPAFQPCWLKMNLIARVICSVWVRPEPSRGRSDATRIWPLPFWIAEQDDAGRGVALLRANAPLTVATSAAIAMRADAPAPTYMRFFTRPPVWGVRGMRKSIERRGDNANPAPGYAGGERHDE